MIKEIRREVGTIRPSHGTGVRIKECLSKVRGVTQWLKYRAIQLSLEIDPLSDAVIEQQIQGIRPNHGDLGEVNDH